MADNQLETVPGMQLFPFFAFSDLVNVNNQCLMAGCLQAEHGSLPTHPSHPPLALSS